jgi:microcystin-dependent protein
VLVAYPSDNLADVLTTLGTDAGTASASLGTISAGSDVLVSNFAGLQSLVNDLSSLASVLKGQTFYVPVGGIIPFGGDATSVLPGGWLLCDGTSKLRSDYPDLFSVIGVSYGSVDGTHFSLPDLQGRVPVGKGTHADVNGLNLNDGLGTVASRSPKHAHSFSLTATSGGVDHTHTYSIVAQTNASTGYNTGLLRFADTNATLGGYSPATSGASAYLHTHPVSGTVGVGSGTADTIPYIVTNYIIKV